MEKKFNGVMPNGMTFESDSPFVVFVEIPAPVGMVDAAVIQQECDSLGRANDLKRRITEVISCSVNVYCHGDGQWTRISEEADNPS